MIRKKTRQEEDKEFVEELKGFGNGSAPFYNATTDNSQPEEPTDDFFKDVEMLTAEESAKMPQPEDMPNRDASNVYKVNCEGYEVEIEGPKDSVKGNTMPIPENFTVTAVIDVEGDTTKLRFETTLSELVDSKIQEMVKARCESINGKIV